MTHLVETRQCGFEVATEVCTTLIFLQRFHFPSCQPAALLSLFHHHGGQHRPHRRRRRRSYLPYHQGHAPDERCGIFHRPVRPDRCGVGWHCDEAESSEEAAGPSTKRSRTDPTEIFIDRNPDLFSIVLDFMRSGGKLPAKVRKDIDRLEDLTTEAEFFIYDALKAACDDAKGELKKALSKVIGDEPKAKCGYAILRAPRNGMPDTANLASIDVPKGKVLYLVSAVLAGRLEVKRYKKMEGDAEDGDALRVRGCYIEGNNDETGDFKLQAIIDGKSVCIAHCGMNHLHNQGQDASLQVDFRQPLGLCLSGGEIEPKVHLVSRGFADWNIVYWVGDAEAIPGLKSPDADARGRNMARLQAANAGGDENDETLTSLFAMQLLGR